MMDCACCGVEINSENPAYFSTPLGILCCDCRGYLVMLPHPHFHYEGMNECSHCDGVCKCQK